MVRESRRDKDFGQDYRVVRKQEENFCCEGCSRKILDPHKNGKLDAVVEDPQQERLYVHHSPAVVLGGGRDSASWVLCGPHGCHDVADELELHRGITMLEVEVKMGRYPFRQYVDSIQKGKVDGVAKDVARRINRLH